MKDKINKILLYSLKFILPIVFWCVIWSILAKSVNNNFILPNINVTFLELANILTESRSYIVMLNSLLRVLLGLCIGSILGILLAVLSYNICYINCIVSPMISVIKSTPVASFILVLWVYFSGDGLPVTVGILMVLPIIWQSVIDGFSSINRDLVEVAQIFEFSYAKKLRILIFPALRKYLRPAIITATGLAWKSEIAAEIIGYTKKSIGQYINDAKYEHETAKVFAWSLIIIVLSIILEKTTKAIIRRTENVANHQ